MSRARYIGGGSGVVLTAVAVFAAWPGAGSAELPARPGASMEKPAEPSAEGSSPSPTPLVTQPPVRDDDVATAPLDCARAGQVVAAVGGVEIGASRLCEALRVTVGEAGPRWRQAGPALLERLVDHAVIEAEGLAKAIDIGEAEVEAELARGGAAQASGYVREEVVARLRLRALARGDRAAIDRARVEAEFASDPSRWASPGRATLEGALVRVRAGESAEQTQELERRAQALREALGVGHEDVQGVIARSPGAERLEGWALETSGLEPALEAAVFSGDAQHGGWLGPIKTRVGWVVVRASAVALPSPRVFEEVEPEVRRALDSRLGMEAERTLLAELRARAKARLLVAW